MGIAYLPTIMTLVQNKVVTQFHTSHEQQKAQNRKTFS